MMANSATAPRPRGRPRVSSPKQSSVTTWLDPKDADKLIRLATQREEHVSALVRSIIKHRLGT